MDKGIMQKNSWQGAANVVLFLMANMLPFRAYSEEIDTTYYKVSLFPDQITTSSVINVVVERKNFCYQMFLNATELDTPSRAGNVSLYWSPANFTGCPYPERYEFAIGNFSEPGEYEIQVFEEVPGPVPDFFQSGSSIGSINLTVSDGDLIGYPETPQEGSIQSGIGLIRGWACQASSVQIQFDEGPLLDVAYGTSRTDTFAVCGDTNNGYGMVYAWGLLGHGTHRMKTYIDHLEVSDVEFQVDGLSSPFIRGLTGEYVLDDFPTPNESVTVRWSEADQNFIIIDN